MKEITYILFNFFVIAPFFTMGQVATDTLPEIDILGFPEERFAVGNRITHIDSGLVKLYSSTRLADILQQTTPVYIKAYGPGNLASIAFRGTGANHTAVLWNGININSPTLGQADFYTLPNFAFDEIAIHHGNGSALYGTGAIGGTVQLGNHAKNIDGWKLNLQQGLGSFGKWQSALGASFGNQTIQVATKVFYTQAKNDFEFINTERFGNPTQRQQNAAYYQWGVVNDVFWDIDPMNKLSFHVWYNKSDRELQPPMTRLESDDEQLDENFRSLLSYQHLSDLGTSTLKLSWIRDFMHFTDGGQVDSRILTDRFTGLVSQEKRFGKKIDSKIGLQLTHFKADVENYQEGTNESRWDLFWLTTIKLTKKLKTSIQLRQTLLQNFDPPFTPSLGVDYQMVNNEKHQFSLNASLSKAYRVPTLNERFWQPGGNPDILPEESHSIEGSWTYKLLGEKTYFEVSGTTFRSIIDEWVYWRPVPPNGTYSPQNVQKVRTAGQEIQLKLDVKLGKMKHILGGNYAYTDAVVLESDEISTVGDELFYVPKHKGNLYYQLLYKGFALRGNWSYTGTRIAIARNELEAFNILDLGLRKLIAFKKQKINLQFRANNVLDRQYQNYEFYAMPKRNYELSIGVQL